MDATFSAHCSPVTRTTTVLDAWMSIDDLLSCYVLSLDAPCQPFLPDQPHHGPAA